MIDKFRLLIENFSEFWILCTAVELDIFKRINKGSGSIYEVAENWHRETVEALCNCLVAYNYLEKSGNEYKLTEESKKYLLKDSPDYIGYFAESARHFDILSQYTTHIKDRKSFTFSEKFWETMVKLSSYAEEGMIQNLIEKFPELQEKKLRILDLGCGKMNQSIQLAKINPNISVMGVDSSKGIVNQMTDYLKKNNLTHQIRIIHDNIENYDTTKKYDVIFINHLLHCLKNETNEQLIKKTKNWLNQDGKIIIFEDLLNDDKVSPKESVKKNLLVKSLNSKIYTITELNLLLSASDFKNIQFISLGRRIIVIGGV